MLHLQGSRARLWKVLFTLVDLYAAGMVAYLLLRTVSARVVLWPVELVSTFLHLILLPTIPLLLLALLLKRRRSILLLGIGSAAYLLLFGELFLPDLKRPDTRGDLTLMTYNTANGSAAWDELERTLRTSGADVVALQEVVAKEVPLYRRDLSDVYPYQVFYDSGLSGVGVVSRFPINGETPTYFVSYRPYMVVDLDLGGRRLTVISAHPPVMLGPGEPAASGRADYVMLADLALARGNTIVAGDLNLTDQHDGYSTIVKRGLADAQREAGLGFGLTFPRRVHLRESVPLIRIDYILTTPDLRPIRTWIGPDGGSDHLPVLATIGWSEGDGG